MAKNKFYSFNRSAFKEFVDREETSPTAVSKAIGKANGYWGMKSYSGDSMDAATMCKLCNTYGLSPLDFFCEEKKPMSQIYQPKNTNIVPHKEQKLSSTDISTKENGDSVHEYEQKIFQLKQEHKDEMHRAEIEKMKQLAEMREQFRRELKEEMEADRIRIEDRYEEKLSRKDEQIAKLMRDLADLQAQYKELELSQRSTGGFGYPRALAESDERFLSK